jgi:hypothetical protein
MFYSIQYDSLVPGTKYKIDNFIGIYIKTDGIFLKFYMLQRQDIQRFRFFKITCNFYQFIPQNPQWQMERRSVNMIIQRIIGDECFIW